MYSYNQTINSEAKIYNHFKIYASIIKLFFPCAKYTQFFFLRRVYTVDTERRQRREMNSWSDSGRPDLNSSNTQGPRA